MESLSSIKEVSSLNPNDIKKVYNMEIHRKFMIEKINNPKLNQAQIAGRLGVSVSKLQRIRTDLEINSPYRYDTPLKKSNKLKKKNETENINTENINIETEKTKNKETTNDKKPVKLKRSRSVKKSKNNEIDEIDENYNPEESLY